MSRRHEEESSGSDEGSEEENFEGGSGSEEEGSGSGSGFEEQQSEFEDDISDDEERGCRIRMI